MIKHQCVERKASFCKKNQKPASCELRKNEQPIAIATDEISLPSSGHKNFNLFSHFDFFDLN